MKKIIIQFVSIAGFMALSACGGGGGGVEEPITTNPPDPNNQTPSVTEISALSDTSAGISDITAFGLFSNNSTGELRFDSETGQFVHSGGSATLDQETVNVLAGFSVDGNNTADYTYIRSFTATYDINGVPHDINGIFGIPAIESEMPKTGDISYTGHFTGTLTNKVTSESFDLVNGQSTLTVDFLNGGVDARFTGFTGNNNDPNSTASVPIDLITIDNMSINGAIFSGGTLTASMNGATVDITGANTSTTAMGGFFGTSNPNPAEAGGGFLSQGDSGILTGSFAGSENNGGSGTGDHF